MATAANNKKKKVTAASKISKAERGVGKKVESKNRSLGTIVSAIAAPVALLAIGYGLTRLDARMGGKVVGMLLNR